MYLARGCHLWFFGFMEQIRCVVGGDSHMLCMGDGNEQEGPRHDLLFDDGHIVLTRLRPATREEKFNGVYWREVAELAAGHTAALCWQGNQHIVGGLFAVGAEYDVIVPGETEPPLPGAVLVPHSVVIKWFDKTVGRLAGVLGSLRAAGVQHLVVVATPPPKANHPDFLRVINRSKWFSGSARRAGVEVTSLDGLTSLRSRYKLWRILQQRYAQIAADCGASYVRHPEGVQGEDGALLPMYGAGDISHANRAYGDLLRLDLVKHLRDVAA